MSVAAASRHTMPITSESIALQLTEEELDKLQEIHELICLMLRELPLSPQIAAQPYFTQALPMSPYTHTYIPWGVSPYIASPGFQGILS